jgi:hypothetical protein
MSPAVAQTGPGGVGTDDGTSDLELWVRGNSGITLDGNDRVETWADQSGNGRDLTQGTPDDRPTTTTSGFGSQTVVDFDGNDVLPVTIPVNNGENVAFGSDYSIFVVGTKAGSNTNETFLGATFGSDGSTKNLVVSGDANGALRFLHRNNGGDDDNRNSSGFTPTAENVLTFTRGTPGSGDQQRWINGGNNRSVTANQSGFEDGTTLTLGKQDAGRFLQGSIAETIILAREVNPAERTIIENYLSTKYAVGLATGDKYGFDANYGTTLAGIGRASSTATHLSSTSSVLNLSTASFAGNGDYVFFGHDGAGASSFSFATTAPLSNDADNDGNADVERIDRQWRVDLTSISGETTLQAAVEDANLPSKTSSDYDYVVIVDDSEDFSTDPTVFDITDDGSGTFTGDITISDGDYVTIGAVKRVVQFAGADGDAATVDGSVAENVNAGNESDAGETDATATLAMNYPYTDGTTAQVAFSASGTEAPAANPGNGDFDAAGPGKKGDGSDDSDGSNNDFDLVTSGPVSLSSSTADVELEVHNDGTREQTQYVEIALDAGGTSNAAVGDNGGDGTVPFVLGITDDDEPRKLAFDASSTSVNEGEGGGTRNVSLTVNLNDVRANSDEKASQGEPCTSVRFDVDFETSTDPEESTVILGDVANQQVPDVQLAEQSAGTGCDTEYQTRDADGEGGRLFFEGGEGTATVEVVVNEDEINDFDTEDLVLDLSTPVSGALSSSNPLSTTLTLTDDPGSPDNDPAPDVEVSPSSADGSESAGSVSFAVQTVRPSNPDAGSEGDVVPSSRTVEVPFALDAGNSTATEGANADFEINTTSPLTFDETETSQTVSFVINDDSESEFSETIEIDLQGGSGLKGATLGSPSSHRFTILDNENLGATGPGGVGATDGTGDLELWVRGNSGITLDGSNRVETWADQSGNGRDLTQGTPSDRPITDTSGFGGRTSVDFDGDDVLPTSMPAANGENVAFGSDYSIFIVGTTDGSNTQETFLGTTFGSGKNLVVSSDGNGDLRFLHRNGGGSDDNRNSSGFTPTAENILTFTRGTPGSGDQQRWINGGNNRSVTANQSGFEDGTTLTLGKQSAGRFLQGSIAEAVVLGTEVNPAERTIIENYLSAKYDITLSGTDVYAGDTNANGNYGRGVFGIGRESAGAFHPSAETDGLRFEFVNGFDDGDYLLAGHRVATNLVNTSDTDGVTGLEKRMERTWYVDRTEPSTSDLTVDVTFDLSEADLVGPASGSSYVLLTRGAGSGPGGWSEVSGTTLSTSGDQITFSGADLTSGDEITLGTTDDADSPIDTGALQLTVEGTAGADGTDQGWRYLGFPGRPDPSTAPQIQDLRRDDGSQFINFGLNMAYRNDGEPEDQNSGDLATRFDGSGFSLLSSGDELPLGRGFLVWIYDDSFYPVDPSITLQTPASFAPIGSESTINDVTVGDETPSAGGDPPLSTDDDLFLLANPYGVPFDLNDLGTPGSDEFSTSIQIWEADATQSNNDPSGTDDGNVGSFVMQSRDGGAPLQDRLLAPWQGFLLTRTSSSGNTDTDLLFSNAGREEGETPPFVGSKSARKNDPPPRRRLALELIGRAADSSVVALDKAVSVLFREGAAAGRDPFDAPKLAPMGGGPALSPVATAPNDTSLRAQESRPLPDGRTRVPLAFRPAENADASSYTIRSPEWEDVPDGWIVELVDTRGTADRTDDRVHTLQPGGAGYPFAPDSTAPSRVQKASLHRKAGGQATTDSLPRPRLSLLKWSPPETGPAAPDQSAENASSAERKSGADGLLGRFYLKVTPGEALPVEMTGFDVNASPDGAQLTWQTASETGNAGFYVQHQRLGGATDSTVVPDQWERLGFVEGAGTTSEPRSYRFETEELMIGTHAFRLRQVDTDGTAHTTATKRVAVRLSSPYKIDAPYPNPARNRVTLPVTVREKQDVTVRVYDILGRSVHVVRSGALDGQETRAVTIPTRDLASGAYFVRVKGDDFAVTRRFTVVR